MTKITLPNFSDSFDWNSFAQSQNLTLQTTIRNDGSNFISIIVSEEGFDQTAFKTAYLNERDKFTFEII